MKCPLFFAVLTLFGFLYARAEPPPAPLNPKALFDGKTLAGWEGDPKIWRVQDGCITGGSLENKIAHNDFLCTTASYANFVLRTKFKLMGDPATGMINSGVQIRTKRIPNNNEVSGYQCDMGDPEWWGAIYDEGRRNKLLAPSDMKALEPVLHRTDWNEYVIRADGARLTLWINGVQTCDYTETDPTIADSGIIGMQIHAGGKALVQYKEMTIEELPPTPAGKKFVGAAEPAKEAKVSPLTAEEQKPTFTVPPGFEIELVAAEEPGIGKFVTVDWDQQGRMWSMTAFDYPVDGSENAEAAKALYGNPGKDKVIVFDTPFASGVQKPRVFAEGLAIPLGVLPYKNGAYVHHGSEIKFLSDTDGDGKADKSEVILGGFGTQDSHLMPHQFTRAPGGWIWMAQGAFISGKVRDAKGGEVQFDRTRMARFRYDGSQFDITSQGPCNIWGLVMNSEGETFIQEANDYGYPVMPFHEYANYPGCSDGIFKSYAPDFPGTAEFRMGGTGLSGLALSDKNGAWPEAYADVMYVANPITRRINSIKILRDGPRYKLLKLPDLVASSDEWFRPVSIHFGPDGCLYIVDWYNKIISHNEVPRNHPDRDKTRGRIWRVKPVDQHPFPVADFTKLPGESLVAKLGGNSLTQSHLAWQAITDRQLVDLAPGLKTIVADKTEPAGRRIASLWALEGLKKIDFAILQPLLSDGSRNVRREAVRAFGESSLVAADWLPSVSALVDDEDPEVRAQVIRTAGTLIAHPWSGSFARVDSPESSVITTLVKSARGPLAGPIAPATRDGKPQKVREAYEREFERYLVRLFLEQQPGALAKWLDSEEAKGLPIENRLVASLALEPRMSAARVAQLLPKLTRAPGQEEVLRLAQFLDEPGVGEALAATLQNVATRTAVLEALLAVRNRLDNGKLQPILTATARKLFVTDEAGRDLAVRLASGFQLSSLEPELLEILNSSASSERQLAALRALREMGSLRSDLFFKLVKSAADPLVRDEALNTLASSKNEATGKLVLALWPDLSAPQKRNALARLASTKAGAHSIVEAIKGGAMAKADLDGAAVDKLQAVLGDDRDLAALMQELGDLFRPVLLLDGTAQAFVDPELTLDGAFTIESWVRLEPGIGNEDGLLSAPGQVDMNFYGGNFRVWIGGGVGDIAIAKKATTPDLWTHYAVTRDIKGNYKIYIDGTLDSQSIRPVPGKLEHLRIGSTQQKSGTAGAISEFRVWNRVRTDDEIRTAFDRSFEGRARPEGVIFYASGAGPWGKPGSGAKVAKTSDFPPLLTEAEAVALDTKFAKARNLAAVKGDSEHGKTVASLCMACHLIKGQGGNLAPNLSSAGAMGLEALLRNIITPNAAMEAGYRIFRVELKSGDVIDGFFVSEDKNALLIRIPGADERRIGKNEIRKAAYLRRSLMPEGILEGMPAQDVSDLFAYLLSLK
ncbi:MAG: hypothetical protein JWL59_4719 [Chthoniobacteraceae bacterium]|nr:hypothetical protein [Chthoniobacteraceae bacterium]